MIVPEFWAEHSIRSRKRNRQLTVRRFGWSDESAHAAFAHARERAQAAFDRITSGEKLPRREPRVAYNGAEGIPIREEIVHRHGPSIITRNGYGALCLNTPDVLFADLDNDRIFPARGCAVLSVLSAAVAAVSVLLATDWIRAIGALVLALVVVPVLLVMLFLLRVRLSGGAQNIVRRQIIRMCARYPHWHIRMYETPAGFRLLVTHQTFVPGSEEVESFFKALRVDPVYATMCRRQQCFRARVSPKPWRIGMASHIRPRRGAWPVKPEHVPARQEWLEEYSRRCESYASCRFEREFGTAPESDAVRTVRELHDDYCRAHSGLPIA